MDKSFTKYTDYNFFVDLYRLLVMKEESKHREEMPETHRSKGPVRNYRANGSIILQDLG